VPSSSVAARALARLGARCAKHARVVIGAWFVLALAASMGVSRLPHLLYGGGGNIPGSMSEHVEEILRTEFANPRAETLVFALRSRSLERENRLALKLLRELQDTWERDPGVAEVLVDADIGDRRLRPRPEMGHFVVINLRAADVREAEQAMLRVRSAAEPILRTARAAHPDLSWATTGRVALVRDLNDFNAADTAKAELRALPLALVVLVLACGSVAAAGIPIVLGFAAVAVALGLVALLADLIVISTLVQSIASMIGLALGIDYSLFVIHRYRQEVRGGREGALERAMEAAGPVVLASGATVVVGMAGLLATPLVETRSIGLGGGLVAAVAVALALTLLPALLGTMSAAVLDWPRAVSSRLRGRATSKWMAWATFVTRHPVASATTSLALLVFLALPAAQTRFGFPEAEFLPPELEYVRGLEMVRGMGVGGLLSPIPLVLTDTRGGPAFTEERLPALRDFAEALQQDRRVTLVLTPLDDQPGLISKDGRRLLAIVIACRDCTLEQGKALAREIPTRMKIPGLALEIGGQAQDHNDFDVAMRAAYPVTLGFVFAATGLVLLVVFRAPLAAAKALFLNALSVLAGYGVVVYVFQQGHGSAWLGVAAPTAVVPLSVPLLVFCILFGLSMDYELFLLSRAREAWRRTGDNAESVRRAVAETGSVITSAALIMVAVFGAFAGARVVLVQMIGLGLAVAVIVDATVIRSILGPALMQVAGRWNWWPGTRPETELKKLR
jgi:RND superfamily putative drug exporter